MQLQQDKRIIKQSEKTKYFFIITPPLVYYSIKAVKEQVISEVSALPM